MTDSVFNSCRGCFTSDAEANLTSINQENSNFRVKLALITGIDVSDAVPRQDFFNLIVLFLQLTHIQPGIQVLMCQECIRKLKDAFNFALGVRGLHTQFFSPAL
jgi:energy-converting hydrogenase Eha subunit H